MGFRGKHGNHAKGRKSGRWSSDKIISSHGYVKIRVGTNHPLADPNGYAYEHLIVWMSAGNQRPLDNEVLHHKNEDKTDNRLSNLEVVNRGRHNTHHNLKKERDVLGRFVTKKHAGRLLDGREWNEMPEGLRQ